MPRTLLTADARRPDLVNAAVRRFARGGYAGTSVASVAAEAGISAAYAFKLFPRKEQLFAAAVERCFDLVVDALERGADTAQGEDADSVLDAMGGAYAALIADRDLLLLQVHAQSVAEIAEVGAALRHGLGRVAELAAERSGGTPPQVQRFVAYGQLCHLVVTAGLDDVDADWARGVTAGIRHP